MYTSMNKHSHSGTRRWQLTLPPIDTEEIVEELK